MFRRLHDTLAEDPVLVRLLAGFAVFQVLAAGWDLPSAWGWEVDGIAPRELFLGLANTLRPGHMHRYPLLQYAIVAVAALPVLVYGALTAEGWSYPELEARFTSVDVMTGISIMAKLVTIAMGCVALWALARIVRRTLSVSAGRWAAVFAMTNLTFGYYARTTNLDVPYLMWTALALDRLLTVLERGDRRDFVSFGILAAASIATKDQAYAGYVLTAPLYLVVVPWLAPSLVAVDRRTHFERLAVGAVAGAASLFVLNGAVWNPSGFARRLEFLTGPAKEDWRVYTRTLDGLVANVIDLVSSQAAFWWPWPVVVIAWLGIALAVRSEAGPGVGHAACRLLPLVAALSSLLFFTLLVGRCEHRFALPAGFWLSSYAGCAVAWATGRAENQGPTPAVAARVAAALIALMALRAPLSLAVTQWHDARREVETFLASLAPGTTVETYGRIINQPRFDPAWGLDAVHVHPDKGPRERPPMQGVTALRAPFLGVFDRRPDFVVLPYGFAVKFAPVRLGAGLQHGEARAQYHENPAVLAHFRRAREGHLPGYRLVLRAETAVPGWARAVGLYTETFGGLLGPVRVFRREGTGGDAQARRGPRASS